MNRSAIDRDYPHQVSLPAEASRGGDFVTIQLFCEGLSLCPRGYSFRRGDRYFIAFCFADREHAERFRVRFAGEMIDPANRPRWP